MIVARLSEEKNIELAIHAFSRINRSGYKLHVYGEGPLKLQLQDIALECGVAQEVFFEGQVSSVINEIKDAEILILSSNYEGMPNTLIEGMVMGLACISTNFPSGAAEELITNNENGMLIPVNGEDELVRSLQELINNNDLRKKIQQNAISLRDKLEKSKIIDQWIQYIKVIQNRNK